MKNDKTHPPVNMDKALKNYENAYGVKLTDKERRVFNSGYAFGVADCYIRFKGLPKK